MLRPFAHPVVCCCAKFETGQTFQPTTPNISFVLWSPKRSATMLDPFARFFRHCWGHARSFRMDYKDLWVVFFPRCTAGPKLVTSVCTPLPTRTKQLPTLLAQKCWELLRPFAPSLSLQHRRRQLHHAFPRHERLWGRRAWRSPTNVCTED